MSGRMLSGARPQLRRERRARRPATVPLPLSAIPRATYRVQLNSGFTFKDLTALVPYLAALGVSHVYCSPYLRARPGSSHGYDIVDHRHLNPEIGTVEDFGAMIEALHRHGMSHLCDFVPNHMAVMGRDNAWWMDVLENGPASQYASYFDIDWSLHDPELAGKVLVPVLGDPYGSVLERGELKVEFDVASGTVAIIYFEHRFPLDPCSYGRVLTPVLLASRLAMTSAVASKAKRIVSALESLPSRNDPAPRRRAERQRGIAEQKRRLADLAGGEPALARVIASGIARFNAESEKSSQHDELHALLELQPYRLAFWRVASDEINYRRFFDINELAGLRMEDEAVFDATHGLILGLAAEGAIGGLRIDHPDGLFDPERYFERLQQDFSKRVSARRKDADGVSHGLFVVLEKISASHERLPATWPVHGTTGYRFANVVNGLFVDSAAKARVDRAWRAFAGADAGTADAQVYRGKRVIMEGALASELAMLTWRALRIARADRRTRDFTFNTLRVALREVVAHFPVYRTYVDERSASLQDRRYVEWAVARALSRSRSSDARVFDFLRDALLGQAPSADPDVSAAYREFAMRAQQVTSPVAAKGVEDTAFYTFNRLVSLNEVGGDLEQFGTSVHAFHRFNHDAAGTWPHSLLASSTHDNKRVEDVRGRIDVISEIPAEWRRCVERWSRQNRSRVRETEAGPAPSRNDEYLLYQTLVGTFPSEGCDAVALSAYRERIERYMLKAAREAKVRTSWLAVNPEYEDALLGFVRDVLSGPEDNRFLEDLQVQCAKFAWIGLLNSVSMTLLKLASPGVPDFYQGTELLDDSLVDPDNRRPVNYPKRRAYLADFANVPGMAPGPYLRSLFGPSSEGRAKLWIIARCLAYRRERAALFALAGYRPIAVSGSRAQHVVAFVRTHGAEGIICAAGRLFASIGLGVQELPLGTVWGDTTLDTSFLPAGARLINIVTGAAVVVEAQALSVADLFGDFPGAMLHYRVERD